MSPKKQLQKKQHLKKLPKTATEPALIRGFIVAVLSLLTTLGVSWAADVDKETIGTLVAIAVFVIPILQALWTRYAVTANSKVVARVSVSQDAVVAGDAAEVATGQVLEVFDVGDGEKTMQPVPLNQEA